MSAVTQKNGTKYKGVIFFPSSTGAGECGGGRMGDMKQPTTTNNHSCGIPDTSAPPSPPPPSSPNSMSLETLRATTPTNLQI